MNNQGSFQRLLTNYRKSGLIVKKVTNIWCSEVVCTLCLVWSIILNHLLQVRIYVEMHGCSYSSCTWGYVLIITVQSLVISFRVIYLGCAWFKTAIIVDIFFSSSFIPEFLQRVTLNEKELFKTTVFSSSWYQRSVFF